MRWLRSSPVNEWESAQETNPLAAAANQAWSTLIAPELLLPIQYFGRLHRRQTLDGERQLMLSVLDDAIACFTVRPRPGDAKAQRLAAEAEAWINLRDSAWLFSFDNICAALELDPDYLRGRLRQWKERCSREAGADHGCTGTIPRRRRRKVSSPVISVG